MAGHRVGRSFFGARRFASAPCRRYVVVLWGADFDLGYRGSGLSPCGKYLNTIVPCGTWHRALLAIIDDHRFSIAIGASVAQENRPCDPDDQFKISNRSIRRQ